MTARADELGTFVTAARDRYDLGGRPVVAVGFSNGANIAGALLLVSPQPVRAAALLAAMPMLSASPPSDLTGVAVFCGGGTHDPVATPRHVEALARALSERGAAVDVHWHPDGHSVHPTTITAATAWLAERVPATRT